jgi:hypothetical protein
MSEAANGLYILNEKHEAVLTPDLMEWAMWIETSPLRTVKQSRGIGPYRVSTVFLGLDHNFAHCGPRKRRTADPLRDDGVLKSRPRKAPRSAGTLRHLGPSHRRP